MDEANFTSIQNISLFLRSRELATSSATFTDTVRNVTVARNVASNAYEWRFILPPYFLIFLLSVSGNCMVIATLASNKRMRTVTNVYLLNLVSNIDLLLFLFYVFGGVGNLPVIKSINLQSQRFLVCFKTIILLAFTRGFARVIFGVTE